MQIKVGFNFFYLFCLQCKSKFWQCLGVEILYHNFLKLCASVKIHTNKLSSEIHTVRLPWQRIRTPMFGCVNWVCMDQASVYFNQPLSPVFLYSAVVSPRLCYNYLISTFSLLQSKLYCVPARTLQVFKSLVRCYLHWKWMFKMSVMSHSFLIIA